MKTIFTMALATTILAGYFSSYSSIAPDTMPTFTEADATDAKPRVHPVKIYYDRIGPETELYRQPRCKTPGTIWYQNACWRPERIVANE